MADDDRDWESEFLERQARPEFGKIRSKLATVVEDEDPAAAETLFHLEKNPRAYEAFVAAYDEIERVFFRADVDQDTLARSRKGDTSASEQLAIELGIVDALKHGAK